LEATTLPYLDHESWVPPSGRPIPPYTWIPELDGPGWNERHPDPSAPDDWIRKEGLTADALLNLQLLPPNEKEKRLLTLGADIGSVQRDSVLYTNFLEQLKLVAPLSTKPPAVKAANQAADDVVTRMKMMGLTSVNWSPDQGGPPREASLRPWRDVVDWLWRQLAKVGRFLANSIEAFMALARDLVLDALTAISFSVSIPPALGFEIDPNYFTDNKKWSILKRFIDAILTETEKLGLAGAPA
jgi:hypothetical protein